MDQRPRQQLHTNRLAQEKSPYLLQHAHNPVDWYPWGEEAFARARQLDRPLFVSIGYSTCHWCHVMEQESFDDPAIAELLNEHFVPVKVDREERADVDEIYMGFVQALTGQGGWPLSVWLTPERAPFFGGTYFPPDERYGRPSFAAVLRGLAQTWRQRRADVQRAAAEYGQQLAELGRVPAPAGTPTHDIVERAFQQVARLHDDRHGGFGSAPKFPRADFGALCLRRFHRTRDAAALRMACQALDAMAAGGIYDHLGGGFARYSTDAGWRVPHFEKMLYDNAQLAFHYLEAHQLTGDARYARVAGETLDYVLRDMTLADGGFASAEDADSEGEEGRFYLWSLEEIERSLPRDLSALFAAAFGVTASGNFEGANILHRALDAGQLAQAYGAPAGEIEALLHQARQALLAIRAQRVRPLRDDKVLTAWNGLMIQAFARGAVVLRQPRYLVAAQRAADFALSNLRAPSGLLRRWREGQGALAATALEYASLVRGLLELYQASLDARFVRVALQLHQEMMARFADPSDGALFTTAAGEADLIVRVKAGYDGSVPTANSLAAANALTLFELTGERGYAGQCERMLEAFSGVLAEQPLALASMALVLDAWLGERVQLVLAGSAEDPRTQALHGAARRGFHPHLTISLAPAHGVDDPAAEPLAPLVGKVAAADGSPLAYACRGFACRAPTGDPEALAVELGLTRAQDRI